MAAQLNAIIPRLPSRNLAATNDFYTSKLGFEKTGDYPDYLMLRRDNMEIHFFLFKALNPLENYGSCYLRASGIDTLYKEVGDAGYAFTENQKLQIKPWRQKEFSMIDPDHNLLTFGESI